ncbi:transmembrane protein 45B-like [Lytechinus pictus]|uniref:transmembrane protein 45B-like n=1 Tax=Lytechinus pictus TaxID=7653 RepID=UPI00240DC505|nr:transmembrane protein 45B-like [Lytechinus pictus]XP_054768147.1 transmembrane protein 45B-like [Lytechinus pictus]
MGSFGGHAVPGGFFIIVAIWWIIQLAYTTAVLDNGRKRPRSRLMQCLHRAPIEAGLIIFGAVAGIVVEMAYSEPILVLIDKNGEWQNDVEWGHCSMYLYFGLYGFVKTIGATCVPSVARYEQAFGALAYSVEGFLFYYHTHGRSPLDIHLHSMLVFAIFVCFLSAAGEIWNPDDILIRLIRILFTLVQGTWFWHLGIVLYRPPSGEVWDGEDHLNIMFTTAFFTWHILIGMLVLFVIYCSTKLVLKSCGISTVQYSETCNGREELEIKLLGNTSD